MVIEKTAEGVEAQATTISGFIAGNKDTVVAAKILRVLQKRVRTNKRDRRVSDMFGTSDRLLTPTKR